MYILNKIRRKFSILRDKFSKYQEAITFAQSNDSEYVSEIMNWNKSDKITSEIKKEKVSPTLLLVMGGKNPFSEKIIEYALEMAQRMSYNILALNTAPLSCNTFKSFSSHKQICNEFKTISEKNIINFKERAKNLGISFNHVVLFEEPEDALKFVNSNYDIAFVISETIEDRIEKNDDSRLSKNIYVYSTI